jgi:hypothetical protein
MKLPFAFQQLCSEATQTEQATSHACDVGMAK